MQLIQEHICNLSFLMSTLTQKITNMVKDIHSFNDPKTTEGRGRDMTLKCG